MDFSKALVAQFEDYLVKHQPAQLNTQPQALNRLAESMQYSLKTGGKRFRPVLSMLTAQTVGANIEKTLPVALAVEYIHTYSLIHDDLPVMDNDDVRRGQPTNHKVFGEAVALLAGDALLTESFQHLAKCYQGSEGVRIIQLISEAAGWKGMVGGQVVDIELCKDIKTDWIEFIHENKTGALIRVSVEAAAVACGASEEKVVALREFAKQLGFAFQLADDILDWNPKSPENTSYVNVHGVDETRSMLDQLSILSNKTLSEAGLSTDFFQPLINFNLKREK